MSDMGDDFRAWRNDSKALRILFGVDCPGCRRVQPKRIPTRMLPGQRCKVCRTVDRRPSLTDAQREEADALAEHYEATGRWDGMPPRAAPPLRFPHDDMGTPT